VGDTIEEFASEEATVVVGTVIDPELTDELRVTVVATGLGANPSARAPLQVVESQKPVRQEPVQNYRDLDRPAIERRRAAGAADTGAAAGAAQAAQSEDYFDIPAFLRRQAD